MNTFSGTVLPLVFKEFIGETLPGKDAMFD
jgi:hypothetical protein